MLTRLSSQAPIWSPRATLSHPCWSPLLVETEETYLSPIQSAAAWYHQRSAERGAGFDERHTLIEKHFCALCGIGVGPHHHEEQLYLYPVYHKWIWNNKDEYVYIEQDFLFCCGDCAKRKQRKLPVICCFLDYSEEEEEEDHSEVALETQQSIEILLVLILLFRMGLPVQAFTFSPTFSLAACLLEQRKQETVEPRRPVYTPGVTLPMMSGLTMGLLLPPPVLAHLPA